MADTKSCTKCLEVKALDLFQLHNRGKTPKPASWCKACNKAAHDARIKADPEKARRYQTAWRNKNIEQVRANDIAWKRAHPEKVKAWSADWYAKNKDKSSANFKRWRMENKERNAARTIAWSRTMNGSFAQYKGGARHRGIEFTLTKEQFLSFWQKPCYYTGRPITTIGLDRVDNSKGYTMDNVVPCCKDVNLAKRALSAEAFLALCKDVVRGSCGK